MGFILEILIVLGILFLIHGELLPGLVFLLLGIGLLTGLLLSIRRARRKRNNIL